MIGGEQEEPLLLRRLCQIGIVLCLRLFAPLESHAQSVDADRLSIEILTVEPGAAIFSRWGHIAIMVSDSTLKTRLVYNFGTFDFGAPGLLFRYAKGYLNFRVEVVPYRAMIAFYRAENRGIVSRTLDVTQEEARIIADRLAVNALKENRTYAYRHYLDNCCTRIRNLLNDVLGNTIKDTFETGPTGRSYRYYTRRALTGLPVMRNIILFIMGRDIDRPVTRWDEQFLPEVFGEDLDRITVGEDNRPLVSTRHILFDPPGPKAGERTAPWEVVTSVFLLMLLFLGLGLPLFFRGRGWAKHILGAGLAVWGLTAGLGGLLVILLWTATRHYDCHNNENVLVFPLLHLWLVGPGLKLLFKGRLANSTHRYLQTYLTASLVLLGFSLLLKLGPFFQQNYQFILFAALMNTAGFAALKQIQIKEFPPSAKT